MDELNPPVLVPEQPRPPEELVSESIPESTPPINHPRRLKLFILGGAIVFLAVLIGGIVYLSGAKKTAPKQVACTQEAKQCSDGSYVSRTGPNCAFAPCPTPTPDPTANWKEYRNEQYLFEIKHPANWYAKKYESSYGIQQDGGFWLLFGQEPEPQDIPPLTHPWGDLNIGISKKLYSDEQLQKVGIEQGAVIEGEVLNKRRYEITRFVGVIANKKIQLTGGLVDPLQETQIIFNAKGYGWSIIYPQTDYEGHYDPIYDQILSTFKFLDENQTGVLEGKVTIGPLCPVEPCQVSINPYLGKEVVLKSQAGNTVNIKLNSDGSFSGQVNPGTYSLDLNECQYLGCKATLPKTVTIEAGKTAEVNIDIDTGIR